MSLRVMVLAETIELWRWGVLAVMMGGLLGVWLWANRGKGGTWKRFLTSPRSSIKVCDRRWIGAKTSVALIEVEGERFLLAQTPSAVSWQKMESKKKETRPRNGKIKMRNGVRRHVV